MGGLGSGSQKRLGRRTVESCRTVLDINRLSAQGCLQPGWSGACQWLDGNDNKTVITSISLRAEAGPLGEEWLHLSWYSPIAGGEVTEVVSIVRSPCWRGGSRAYFVCPGAGAGCCGRHVWKLYLARYRFLCRQCSRLAYATRSEAPWQRALRRAARRAARLRQRLGITARIDAPLPEKPSHMPDHVYARLLEELLQAEIRVDEYYTDRILRLARLPGLIERRRSRKPLFTLE